ncbi:MAG: HNH endonuclease [Actinomycetota bacterium]
MGPDLDEQLRAAAFAYLDTLGAREGNVVSREQLTAFRYMDQPMPLVERQRGIRKASGFDAAISILTTYTARPDQRPYDDGEGPDGYPRYKWRGTDPDTYDNRALRVVMTEHKPLPWFVGVAPGLFHALYPVWLVGEEPDQHQFVVALDAAMSEQWEGDPFHPADLAARRRYAQVVVRQRLHQRVFRERVLFAYERQCALCRLRHPELLDAAHILEDAEGGEPIVPNGIAMCAIHHRAFDSNVLGIRPDHVIQVRSDVLAEHDGPTLQHALQGLHNGRITIPSQREARPKPELLEARFERFKLAG